jgi:hypothetical protein
MYYDLLEKVNVCGNNVNVGRVFHADLILVQRGTIGFLGLHGLPVSIDDGGVRKVVSWEGWIVGVVVGNDRPLSVVVVPEVVEDVP